MSIVFRDEDEDVAIATRDANPAATANIFGKAANVAAAASVEGQRAIAEVQAAMFIAQQAPRNERAAIDRIINMCSRETLAKSAIYSYARGGTAITGPSIRLAEAMAQRWGNLSFGIRELDQRNGESVVEAFCWDLERQYALGQGVHRSALSAHEERKDAAHRPARHLRTGRKQRRAPTPRLHPGNHPRRRDRRRREGMHGDDEGVGEDHA